MLFTQLPSYMYVETAGDVITDKNSALSENCYHCGEPLIDGQHYVATIADQVRSMCCPGCAAVAKSICELGLMDYYLKRESLGNRAETFLPEQPEKLEYYDHPKVQAPFTKRVSDEQISIELLIEGIRCPSCSWLCESRLKRLPGIISANVNFSNHRANIIWDKHKLNLSEILKAIRTIGYKAYPYDVASEKLVTERQRKKQLQNIGITAVLGMQVMMISIALYFGKDNDMPSLTANIFHWINLVLTIPVIFLAGMPFLKKALNDLRNFYISMDMAISLGICIAFIASVINTIRAEGEVYFDTIVMFIFLISLSRYFEFMQRRKSIQESIQYESTMPTVTNKVNPLNSKLEIVSVADLKIGDNIVIKAGETVVADCIVTNGGSSVDQSLLSGESLPIYKTCNDKVIAGSINIDSPLTARVERLGEDTVLSSIHHLITKAQSERPKLTRISDGIASWFISTVLCIVVLNILYLGISNVDLWLSPTIAILIVSCPCALSLATPSALVVTINRLLKNGVAVRNSHVLGKFHKLSHIIFDKTGTITEGQFHLDEIRCFGKLNEKECFNLASALANHSEHPIAKALRNTNTGTLSVTDFKNHPGKGVSVIIKDKRYFLGKREFIEEMTGFSHELSTVQIHNNMSYALLACENELISIFFFTDNIKPGLMPLINECKQLGIDNIILSGDHQDITGYIANKVGIDHWQGELLPEDKLAAINSLQKNGGIVAMLGDGINDAPTLAKADISIAMNTGADITKNNADIILLKPQFIIVRNTFKLLNFTRKVIQQNICWAIFYNLIALPVAISGYLQPWMAAIGMSISSLIVVANANRIRLVKLS